MCKENERSISVIIVYNNEDKLKKTKAFLVEQDNVILEFIFVNNISKQYSSAAEALNHGASLATGDILVFMHQDLYILDSNGLSKIQSFLNSNEDAVVGVIGMKYPENGNVTGGNNPNYSDLNHADLSDQNIIRDNNEYKFDEVQSLDECFLGLKKRRFRGFDSVTCDDWHMYGCDLCYQNYIFMKGKNYVLDIKSFHDSHGYGNMQLQRSIERIIIKYLGKTEYVNTTCVFCKCTIWELIKRRAYRLYLQSRHFVKILLMG